MNNSITINKEETRVEAVVSAELSKIGITAFTLSAAAIGCWAMIALFAGTISNGGPLNLLRALATAITG